MTTIRAFINLLAKGAVTIDIIETSFTSASERTRNIFAVSRYVAVVDKDVSSRALVDVFTDIISVGRFFPAVVTTALVTTISVTASRVFRTFCSTRLAFINILACGATILRGVTIGTGTFEGTESISAGCNVSTVV